MNFSDDTRKYWEKSVLKLAKKTSDPYQILSPPLIAMIIKR